MTETEIPPENTEPASPAQEEYMAQLDPAIYTIHTITLEKVSGSSEPKRPHRSWLPPRMARVGTLFTYTYKSLGRNEAVQRASAALIREYPDENRMNWKEIR
jgi:hypothetical protein